MKKIFILALMGFVFYGNAMAKGIPVPYCSKCEYITIVADLPDSTKFYSEEYKEYMDIGYKYNQFWLLWLPIWNSDGEYCLTIKDHDVYFDITSAELNEIAKTYNIDLPNNPIPLWDKIGGKLIIGLLIALVIWGYFGKGKKKGNPEKENEEEVEKD